MSALMVDHSLHAGDLRQDEGSLLLHESEINLAPIVGDLFFNLPQLVAHESDLTFENVGGQCHARQR